MAETYLPTIWKSLDYSESSKGDEPFDGWSVLVFSPLHGIRESVWVPQTKDSPEAGHWNQKLGLVRLWAQTPGTKAPGWLSVDEVREIRHLSLPGAVFLAKVLREDSQMWLVQADYNQATDDWLTPGRERIWSHRIFGGIFVQDTPKVSVGRKVRGLTGQPWV